MFFSPAAGTPRDRHLRTKSFLVRSTFLICHVERARTPPTPLRLTFVNAATSPIALLPPAPRPGRARSRLRTFWRRQTASAFCSCSRADFNAGEARAHAALDNHHDVRLVHI